MASTRLSIVQCDDTLIKGDYHTLILSPANGTYTLALKTSVGGTISTGNVITSSGTCDVSVRINGANVVWPSAATVIAASSSINEKAAASANSFGVGAKLEIVISNNSSAANLAISVAFARTA